MSDALSVRDAATRAKQAATQLAPLTRAAKDAALVAMAEALLDRLALGGERIAAMAGGVRDVAALADPVGEVLRGYTLANGLEVRQVRVPLGVVGIIYEARPNVTVDAAGICLKSGNVALLRGSASARSSNLALVDVLARAAASAGVPGDAIQLVP